MLYLAASLRVKEKAEIQYELKEDNLLSRRKRFSFLCQHGDDESMRVWRGKRPLDKGRERESSGKVNQY